MSHLCVRDGSLFRGNIILCDLSVNTFPAYTENPGGLGLIPSGAFKGVNNPQLFIILLTNRVHPTRENRAISRVRPRVADAVVRALAAP